jgi:hypothetical protein
MSGDGREEPLAVIQTVGSADQHDDRASKPSEKATKPDDKAPLKAVPDKELDDAKRRNDVKEEGPPDEAAGIADQARAPLVASAQVDGPPSSGEAGVVGEIRTVGSAPT